MTNLCLILGPYRNLTTLSSACLNFHPNIGVLNHSYYFNENNDTNFLLDFSDKKMNVFMSKSINIISNNISKPGYGGSILYSHAFKNYSNIEELYKKRFGNSKKDIKTLVWKESHKNTNLIKPNILSILNRYDNIKFLLPIRNPIDCAISNMKGYFRNFDEPNDSILFVLKQIINMHSWFLNLEKEYPDNFHHYFQNDEAVDVFTKIADFINVNSPECWVDDVKKVYKIKAKDKHDIKLVKKYYSFIKTTPDLPYKERFMEFE